MGGWDFKDKRGCAVRRGDRVSMPLGWIRVDALRLMGEGEFAEFRAGNVDAIWQRCQDGYVLDAGERCICGVGDGSGRHLNTCPGPVSQASSATPSCNCGSRTKGDGGEVIHGGGCSARGSDDASGEARDLVRDVWKDCDCFPVGMEGAHVVTCSNHPAARIDRLHAFVVEGHDRLREADRRASKLEERVNHIFGEVSKFEAREDDVNEVVVKLIERVKALEAAPCASCGRTWGLHFLGCTLQLVREGSGTPMARCCLSCNGGVYTNGAETHDTGCPRTPNPKPQDLTAAQKGLKDYGHCCLYCGSEGPYPGGGAGEHTIECPYTRTAANVPVDWAAERAHVIDKLIECVTENPDGGTNGT